METDLSTSFNDLRHDPQDIPSLLQAQALRIAPLTIMLTSDVRTHVRQVVITAVGGIVGASFQSVNFLWRKASSLPQE